MSITIEKWRAAADHVKRFDELTECLEDRVDVRIGGDDFDNILHEDSVRRIREFIEQEIRREIANVSEELLQRYGVLA